MKSLILFATVILGYCGLLSGQPVPEIPAPVIEPIKQWYMAPHTKKIYLDRYSTGHFSCGLLPVCYIDKDSRWGFIDTTGILVIDYKFGDKFIDTPQFSENVCAFRSPDGAGSILIDTKGNTIVTLAGFHALSDFRGGIASARQTMKKGQFTEENWVVYINKQGQKVLPNLAQKLGTGMFYDKNKTRPFSEGMMAVFDYSKQLWGYADAKGNMVIAPKYREAEDFSDGLALVQMVESPGLWGYVDKTGRMVIEPKFSVKPLSFSQGYAVVGKRDQGQRQAQCLIDKTGKVVYDGCVVITQFHKGYAIIGVVPDTQEKWPLHYYLIDTQLNRVKKLADIPLCENCGPKAIEYVNDMTALGLSDGTGYVFDYLGNRIVPGNNTGNFYDGLAKSSADFKNKKTGNIDRVRGFINTKGEFAFYFQKPEF